MDDKRRIELIARRTEILEIWIPAKENLLKLYADGASRTIDEMATLGKEIVAIQEELGGGDPSGIRS